MKVPSWEFVPQEGLNANSPCAAAGHDILPQASDGQLCLQMRHKTSTSIAVWIELLTVSGDRKVKPVIGG